MSSTVAGRVAAGSPRGESPRATIEEQADEVGRECRRRERIYPDWIDHGRIRPETAERKLAVMRDAERTLRFLSAHAQGLRALCHFLIASGDTPVPTEAERQALLAHPGIKALLEVWPEAEVRILPMAPSDSPAGSRPDGAQDDLFNEENDAA